VACGSHQTSVSTAGAKRGMASVARNPRRRALVEQRANTAGFKEAHPDSVHKHWSEQSPRCPCRVSWLATPSP
jgi:hypothetical protein